MQILANWSVAQLRTGRGQGVTRTQERRRAKEKCISLYLCQFFYALHLHKQRKFSWESQPLLGEWELANINRSPSLPSGLRIHASPVHHRQRMVSYKRPKSGSKTHCRFPRLKSTDFEDGSQLVCMFSEWEFSLTIVMQDSWQLKKKKSYLWNKTRNGMKHTQ